MHFRGFYSFLLAGNPLSNARQSVQALSNQTAALFNDHASSSASLIILLLPCLLSHFHHPHPSVLGSKVLSSSNDLLQAPHSSTESSCLAGTPVRDEIASTEALSLALLLLRLKGNNAGR